MDDATVHVPEDGQSNVSADNPETPTTELKLATDDADAVV